MIRSFSSRAVVAGLMVLLFVGFGHGQEMPMDVPDGLPSDVASQLDAQRQELLEKLDVVKRNVAIHNAKCSSVLKDSAEDKECLKNMAAVKEQMGAYLAQVRLFNRAVLQARGGAASNSPRGTTPLGWEDGRPERQAWSAELREGIGNHLKQLEMAEDIAQFFPNYWGLSESQRVEAWARLFIEIARIESAGFHPDALGDNGGSIGLFQLSYSDRYHYKLDLDPKEQDESRSLRNPVVNIRCAVEIFASLVEHNGHVIGYQRNKDGSWESSKGTEGAKGAARYWSTLQDRKDKLYLTAIRRKLREYYLGHSKSKYGRRAI